MNYILIRYLYTQKAEMESIKEFLDGYSYRIDGFMY